MPNPHPRFTRQHYELVAETLAQGADRGYDLETLRRLAHDFGVYFETDNPRFEYGRFLRACNILNRRDTNAEIQNRVQAR